MSSITETAPAAVKARGGDVRIFLQRFGTAGIFIILVVVASLWSDSFLTKVNMLNVLRQVASGAGIMAVGMLFVILTRGIDLSVGSIAALGSVLTGYFVAIHGYSTPVTILFVLLAGAACGAVTGAVAGLVAITPASGFAAPMTSISGATSL